MSESAYSVIDRAISENRHGEVLLYVFSAVIVLAGVFVIIFGALMGEGIVALSGSVPAAMIFPSAYLARNMRKQNIAIRLLQVPLENAQTSEEAAEAIVKMLQDSF